MPSDDLLVTMPRDLSQFLEQEKKRLKIEYGLRVTKSEIIRALVHQHMLRFRVVAETDPKAVIWFYRYLKDKDDV